MVNRTIHLGTSWAAAGPTTIYTATLTGDNPSIDGYSHRMQCPVTGSAITQVRVSIKATSAQTLVVAHASIGINNGGGSTTATPVELLYSGASGFTIGPGLTKTSDWLNFTGISPGTDAMVIYDITSGGVAMGTATGTTLWYRVAFASYNSSSGASFSSSANDGRGTVLIETQ